MPLPKERLFENGTLGSEQAPETTTETVAVDVEDEFRCEGGGFALAFGDGEVGG